MHFPLISAHKCFSCPVHLTEENRFDDSVLIDEPQVLRCEIRKIGNDPELREFEKRQNYAARNPGADDLALEAELFLFSELHPDFRKLRIGIPLSMVPGVADFTVKYTGTFFSLYAGDTLLDEEFPFGDPPGMPLCSCGMEVRTPSLPCRKKMSIHTWSPEGLNVWAGDVSLGVFNGEFHLFYLLDRVDAEIAGCRTIIHYFEECHLNRCRVLCGNCSYRQGELKSAEKQTPAKEFL